MNIENWPLTTGELRELAQLLVDQADYASSILDDEHQLLAISTYRLLAQVETLLNS